MVNPSGKAVKVHLPSGNPLNATLPVEEVQVGCVIAPITGAVGGAGCDVIVTFPEDNEVHVLVPSVTVNV
jgi:hypothetical protein